MILQVAVAAVVLVVGQVNAWPITSLDIYNRMTEHDPHTAECGGNASFSLLTDQNFNVTFNSDSSEPMDTDCLVHLRVSVHDDGIADYGLVLTGNLVLDGADGEAACDTSSPSYLHLTDSDDEGDKDGIRKTYCSSTAILFKAMEDIVIIDLKLQAGTSGQLFLRMEPVHICGGIVDEDGSITSPNFPNAYPRNIVCAWYIRPPQGYIVRLFFEYFELAPRRRTKCQDVVYLTSEISKSYCNKELKKKEKIASFEEVLFFRSAQSKKGRGFNCTVKFEMQNKNLLLAKFYQ